MEAKVCHSNKYNMIACLFIPVMEKLQHEQRIRIPFTPLQAYSPEDGGGTPPLPRECGGEVPSPHHISNIDCARALN